MAILTGITFQHLERFKTLDRIIQTKFEITKGLTADSLFITDGENEAVQQGLQRYTRDKPFTIKEI
jgi:UDP-N-acetylmuramyl pentapeptide synthase